MNRYRILINNHRTGYCIPEFRFNLDDAMKFVESTFKAINRLALQDEYTVSVDVENIREDDDLPFDTDYLVPEFDDKELL